MYERMKKKKQFQLRITSSKNVFGSHAHVLSTFIFILSLSVCVQTRHNHSAYFNGGRFRWLCVFLLVVGSHKRRKKKIIKFLRRIYRWLWLASSILAALNPSSNTKKISNFFFHCLFASFACKRKKNGSKRRDQSEGSLNGNLPKKNAVYSKRQ